MIHDLVPRRDMKIILVFEACTKASVFSGENLFLFLQQTMIETGC